MPTTAQLEAARDALGDVLDPGEIGFETFCELQKAYFKLEFMRLAREDGLKYADFAPGEDTINQNGEYVSFGGVKVAGPENPYTDRVVTIDHIVNSDGDVRVSVNGLSVAGLGERPGSYVR